MKYLLVIGLCLISFHIGGLVHRSEGYQKGLADCVRTQEENSAAHIDDLWDRYMEGRFE